MLLSGTVIVDASTTIEEGTVVTEDDCIVAVGDHTDLVKQYPDHECREYDILLPGLVGSHIHSVQSLGRGVADDTALLTWLFDYVLPMEAEMDADVMYTAAKLGYLECIESGTTTVIDHLSVHHADAAFDAAVDVGIRGRLGKVLMDKESPAGLQQGAQAALDETEELIQEYHDVNDGRIQYAVTPRFAVSCTEACLRGCRDLADTYDGVRIHTHASENRDEITAVEEETGMRNIFWLDEVGLTGEDVILAHCVWTDKAERELLAESETHVCHCPSSNMKLASGIAPVIDYLERGINVALGNDGPPCNNTLDAFTEMRQASLLQKVKTLDPTITAAETVFKMATRNGAEAAGFKRIGELREGWKADIIGMTTDVTRATPVNDVFSHIVYAAHGDDVEFTMVNGEVLYDGSEHVGIDAAVVREQAREYATELNATLKM